MFIEEEKNHMTKFHVLLTKIESHFTSQYLYSLSKKESVTFYNVPVYYDQQDLAVFTFTTHFSSCSHTASKTFFWLQVSEHIPWDKLP